MDKALKQRLVGASVLIALAVVVLPMLLSGQQGNPQESRRIDLPPKPSEVEFETRRFPIGDQQQDAPSVLPPAEQSAVVEPVAPDTSAEEPLTDRPVTSEPQTAVLTTDGEELADQPAQQPPPSEEPLSADTNVTDVASAPIQPAAPSGRYLVQVGSYSSVANANRLAGRLRDNRLPVLMDVVETQAGRLHRVRVGPYSSREDAEAALARLNAQEPDLAPRLLDLRPDEASPVADPSDPLVRWVVQVGSFSEQPNAENLVYTLRDAGYRASSVAVVSSGTTAWKVRVGPIIDRRDAVQIAESIKRDLDLDGLVMSTD